VSFVASPDAPFTIIVDNVPVVVTVNASASTDPDGDDFSLAVYALLTNVAFQLGNRIALIGNHRANKIWKKQYPYQVYLSQLCPFTREIL